MKRINLLHKVPHCFVEITVDIAADLPLPLACYVTHLHNLSFSVFYQL